VVKRPSYSEIESKIKDVVLCMILLHPYQVYMLTSSLDYLIVSLKMFNIFLVKRILRLFRFLNDKKLLHITHNVFCYYPLARPHTHMQSSASIHKASELTDNQEPYRELIGYS
jgi:hypothetical protein